MGLPPSRPTRETARLQSRENLRGSCRYTTFLGTHYSRRWKIKFGKNERPVSRRTRGEVLGDYSASQIGCPLDFVTIRDFFAPSHRRSTSPKRGATMRRFIPRVTFSSSQSKCAIGDTHTRSIRARNGLPHYTGSRFAPMCSANHRQPKREASRHLTMRLLVSVNYRDRVLFPKFWEVHG
jgi:hypothetical protein